VSETLWEDEQDPVAPPGAPFDLADERLALAAWSRLAEPGDVQARRLVARMGPGPALAQVLAGESTKRWRTRVPDLAPERDLATLARFGGRLVVPGDDEWPSGVDALGDEAPFCLWVRGPLNLAQACFRAAAVVGARAATAYGERVARDLADGCAERGITVVSGAAFGIDGAAHRGALAAAGPTVAVLACGPDRIYPQGHAELIARIAEVGAVVTEVPPGSSPTRWRFIERNRLIAALAGVTVVVEAAHRSGAMGTAARAEKLSRPVGAVPGPVTSPLSYGTHRLLRDGAVCVTSAEEVAELAGRMGEFLPVPVEPPAAVHDGLDPVDLRVFDALPLRRGVDVRAVARGAGLDEGAVMAALGRLELRRLAAREGSAWRRGAP
jgi:DNA processing protein